MTVPASFPMIPFPWKGNPMPNTLDTLPAEERDYLVALRNGDADPRTEYEWKTKPYRHQAVFLEYARRFPHLFFHGEQGVGKTKSTIDLLDFEADRGGLQRVLVVCPNSIKRNWRREFLVHSRRYDDDAVFVLEGSKAKKKKILDAWKPGIYIANYELIRSFKASGDSLALLDWDYVVADEASKMKHRTSKQSKAMHDFADFCPARRIALTGTPITKSPFDLFSIFRFLDPSIFGKKWMPFAHKFADYRQRQIPGRPAFWEVLEYENLGELTRLAYSIGLQYRKEDCLDLPPKVYKERYVAMPKVVRDVYDNLRDDLVAEIETEKGQGVEVTAANVLAKLGKLRQITSGFVYDGEGDTRTVVEMARRPKLEELTEMLDEIDGPFLVWAVFQEDVHAITAKLADAGVNVSAIHGAVPQEERQEIVDDFQAQGENAPRALVCQTSTCAYGLTLTAASTSIVYSRDANLEHRLQMADRIHRIGQTKTATIIDLVVEDSVDELDLDLLAGKFKLSELVTRFDLETLFLSGNQKRKKA